MGIVMDLNDTENARSVYALLATGAGFASTRRYQPIAYWHQEGAMRIDNVTVDGVTVIRVCRSLDHASPDALREGG
jgi:hypothetical protein